MQRRGSTEPREGEQKRPPVARDEGTASPERVTDGGEETAAAVSETQRSRFQTLFVDVTGAKEVTAEQAADTSSHAIDDDATSISSYVTAVARRDGLTDTIDEPDSARRD
jgi:hypothetical protein